MLFKRSFGLTMSLFIFYVHKHDRLGFEISTVETAVKSVPGLYLIAFVDLVPIATEKVSGIRSNIIWNQWKSTLKERSIRVNLNQERKCKYCVRC